MRAAQRLARQMGRPGGFSSPPRRAPRAGRRSRQTLGRRAGAGRARNLSRPRRH
ncbi:hypothetical protein ISF6_4690 [Piscinibacter sakaiensis]|uniref:Uncharacterized protein n=1 Tax=Piscinibacter sakaiensis TaxID=1547922 RepID=A0A0K8NX57_PISS1|nr:hypothetical protein ISF6_4690 [Piscinibacter sakaiensis]